MVDTPAPAVKADTTPKTDTTTTTVTTTKAPAKPKRKYRLTGGKHFGHNSDGNEVKFVKGDIIALTDREAVAFKDKLEAARPDDELSDGEETHPGAEPPKLSDLPKPPPTAKAAPAAKA